MTLQQCQMSVLFADYISLFIEYNKITNNLKDTRVNETTEKHRYKMTNKRNTIVSQLSYKWTSSVFKQRI